MLICPQTVAAHTATITLQPTDPDFAILLNAISAPVEPSGTGQVCPAYADLLQDVVANTSSTPLLTHLPLDRCGHYQQDVLKAITQARSHQAG